MKKLFSAATSLIMAASAVASSVVPFATGAADSNKGFTLAAFEGAATSISKDAIAAGDVTVPVGIYLNEGSADSQSIAFQMTVKAGTASADPTGVSFNMVTGGAKVNSEAKEYVVGGQTYTTDVLISFCSKLSVNKKGNVSPPMPSTPQASTADSNETAGTKYAYAGFAWVPPTDGYNWTGESSDAFPIAVVNVTFPKGTKEGTYTLDFCDYSYDAAHPENKACMIESGSTKYTTDNGNLSLKSLDITIGEGGDVTPETDVPVATTTATPTDTPVTTTTPSDVTPTPSADPVHTPDSQFKAVDDFVIDMNNGGAGYTLTLDEIKANPTFDINVKISELGDNTAAMLIAKLGQNPSGITVTSEDNYCYAYEPKTWQDTEGTLYCNLLQDSGDPSDGNNLLLDEDILTLTATVDPSSIKAGTYTYVFSRFDVSENGKAGSKEVSPLVIPAVITIKGDEETPAETTTEAPAVQTTTTTTQAAVQTTTTTTQAAVQTTTVVTDAPVGDVLYGDANDNKVVNIADVVVLNKWLNNAEDYNMTAQGKVNADCCDPKAGADINASDSDAIIRSIVHRITLPTDSATLKADQAKD